VNPRERWLAALALGLGLGAPLAIAEAVLRLLPVPTALQTLPVNGDNPVMRFAPERSFVFSQGWNFRVVNRGRTNNFGFINEQDYRPNDTTPLLAVVGDSYVEALTVPYDSTAHGRLARCVGAGGRVYSFGVSGAPLSQYLMEADLARSTFRPGAFAVIVVGNDFDESLLKYRSTPGFHYFAGDGDPPVLQRVDYHPGLLRRLARRSAVARYVRQNLGGTEVLARLRATLGGHRRYVGNTEASFTAARLEDSRKAVDGFLTALPSRAGVPPADILLVVDGMRPALYNAADLHAAQGSFFHLMRRHLIDVAEGRGFAVLDLQPHFIRRYHTDSARLETPPDGHWNSYGHRAVAQTIADSPVFRRLFPRRACSPGAPRQEGAEPSTPQQLAE
jgi:hypothetical protein